METRIDEFDLLGFLFVNYPNDLSLEESRERLELEIMELADEMGVDIVDSENPPCISPMWLFMVQTKHCKAWFDRLDACQQSKERMRISKERDERTKTARRHASTNNNTDNNN